MGSFTPALYSDPNYCDRAVMGSFTPALYSDPIITPTPLLLYSDPIIILISVPEPVP